MCGGRPSAPPPTPPPPPNTGPLPTPVVEGAVAGGVTNRQSAAGAPQAGGTLGDPNTRAATSKTLLGQ
jgi:hypothetical protein